MRVILPQNFQISAINRFTSEIVGSDGNPRSDTIIVDFSKLNFIDGGGYTVLSNSIAWLISKNVEVRFSNFSNKNNLSIRYLDDCGFFYRYLGEYVYQGASIRKTTLPCERITHEYAFGWVENQLSPWIEGCLSVHSGQLSSIRTCIKEVLNNIADHSQVDTGFVHAQHYPNAHAVKVTMSDFGAGIPETIRSRYGQMSDTDAIIYATKEGVTAQSRPNNMGAGLGYLVDTVLANQGIVRFHSLSGNLTCLCDNSGKQRLQKRPASGRYPGTLVELELDTRLFVGDDDERTDFEW